MAEEQRMSYSYQIVMTKCFPKRAESEVRMGDKRTIEFRIILKWAIAIVGGLLVSLPFYFITHFTGLFAIGIALAVGVVYMADNYEPMEGESFFTWLKLFLINQLKPINSSETIHDLFIDLAELKDPELGDIEVVPKSIEIAQGADLELWRGW